MTGASLKRLGWFLLLLALQALVFDHMHIMGYATPFIAVYFVILFPAGSSRSAMLLWSFALGFAADIFTNTLGVASASLTVTAMVQPWLLKINSSSGKMGRWAYIRYAAVCVVFCETVFFALESFSFFNWQDLLISAGGSSALTVLIIAAIESVRTSGKETTE